MELREDGHQNTVNQVVFSTKDHIFTCSKDGSWKKWDINVRYYHQEEPRCRLTVKSRRYKNLEHIAVTEGERLVICSSVKNLEVFDVAKKSSVNIISAAHMAPISCMSYSSG